MLDDAESPPFRWEPAAEPEVRYYDKLFKAADRDKSGSLSGQVAVKFLRLSGLPAATLKDVWSISNTSGHACLQLGEFHEAMRLVALAQMDATKQLTRKLLRETAEYAIPMPNLKGAPLPPVPTSQGKRPPPLPSNKAATKKFIPRKEMTQAVPAGAKRGLDKGKKGVMTKASSVMPKSRKKVGNEKNRWKVSREGGLRNTTRGNEDNSESDSGNASSSTGNPGSDGSGSESGQFSTGSELRSAKTHGSLHEIVTATKKSGIGDAQTTSFLSKSNRYPSESITCEGHSGSITSNEGPEKGPGSIDGDSPLSNGRADSDTGDGGDATSEADTDDQFKLGEKTKAKYQSIFNKLDQDKSGFLSGGELAGIFLKSGLDKEALGKIWMMSDMDEEFAIAFHLVICVAQRKVSLPAELPRSLCPPGYTPPSVL
ncbi:unnamed protein product, partial [Discosporangium mesarthrocarpum]